ncbi:unnamed protein product [Tilletia controversa]|uniref:ubiquitinyl hydrolase 1 n=4 Tax=Tilletia TaxID=13289 RepID=A0A8X7T0L7_9BASI|nr:hypothetical protein CF335_g2247 [Tilletia laevis]KAE8255116.1 hypothetical protein A4X06_0g583 [Tilletia controversa]CAD6930181.1 unnamed protein product [Tilletia caries]CAD6916546.1 unnamed protein product [Tilletia laevis]CAD6946523.1 unnamed protein product [Tilletia controversa]
MKVSGSRSSNDSSRSSNGNGSDPTPTSAVACVGTCPHLATDSDNRLLNLALNPGSAPNERPLLKDLLHRFATGVRWGKKIRSGHVRTDDDEEEEEEAQRHRAQADSRVDDKTALKRRKLLPHPSCVQCGLILHRPFICLTCAGTACFFQEYGAAADVSLLGSQPRSDPGSSLKRVKKTVEQECHIAAHLEETQHPFAFDMYRGTVFCRLCNDIVYDSRFQQVFDVEVNMAAESYRLQGKRAKHLHVKTDSNSPEPALVAFKAAPLPRGLRNMGATCFMNVILQSFLHNPLLRNYFLADRHNTKLCAARENCLACEMDKLFSEFYNSAKVSCEADLGAVIPAGQPTASGGNRATTPAQLPSSASSLHLSGPNSGPSTPYGPTTFLFTIWLTRESAELSQAGQHDAHELFISTLNGLHASLMAPSTTRDDSQSPQRGNAVKASVPVASAPPAQQGGGSTLSRPRARNKRLPTFPAEDRASLPRRWTQLEELPQDGIYPADKNRHAVAGEKRKRANQILDDGEDDEEEDEDEDDDEEEEYFLHPAFSSSTYANGDDSGSGGNVDHPPLTPGLSGLSANACPCVVHRTFAGTIQSDVTCLQCKSTNSTRDPMLDLSLDLRSARSAAGNGKNGKNGANGKKKAAVAGAGAAGVLNAVNGAATAANNKKKLNRKSGEGGADGPEVGDGNGASALDNSDASLGLGALNDDEQHLHTCLERYCSPEALGPQQYTCAQCGSQNGATKQLSLYRLPPVLCIQLKRFEHEHKNGSTGSIKIDVRVRFSLSLDLRDFVTASVRAQGDRIQDDPEAYVYDLFTVIVHEGSMNTGHYTNFSKRKDGWFRFNDDKISQASIPEVLSARAYQLCYIRRQLYNVRPDTIHLA